MPILLVFALTAACLPIDWPAPLIGGGVEIAAAATAAAVVLSLSVATIVRVWVVRAVRREPARRSIIVGAYSRFRRFMFFANLALVSLCVLVFGWGWATHRLFRVEWNGRLLLAPFAEFDVTMLSYLFGAWTIYYDTERAANLPGKSVRNREFFSRAGCPLHQAEHSAFLS